MKFIETLSAEDQAFIHDWISALRSGNFVQTIGKLSTPNLTAFCCIGVAGVISADCPIVANGAWMEFANMSGVDQAPYEKIDRIFIDAPRLFVGEKPVSIELVNLNDTSKANFCEIADYVEEVCNREVV